MRLASLALIALLASSSMPSFAKDPRVESLLKAADLQHEVDEDGDYKVVIEWDKEKRSQLVFVSGDVEELGGLQLYTLFSPAHVLGPAGIDPARARHLLEENAKTKMGAWEITGKYAYFSIKLPSSVTAEQFHKLLLVTAEVADNMELELTPAKDDL